MLPVCAHAVKSPRWLSLVRRGMNRNPERGQLLANDLLFANRHNRLARSREILPPGLGHLLGRDLRDALAFELQFFGRQPQGPHGRKLPRYRLLGLKQKPLNSDEVTLGMGHLVIARRSGGHTVQFVIHLVERSAGDRIADIGAGLERPGLAVSLKKRPGRIGITLIFADVQDQPRAEHAAVDSVGYLDCGVVRRTAQGTERTEHESGLYRTWPAHE